MAKIGLHDIIITSFLSYGFMKSKVGYLLLEGPTFLIQHSSLTGLSEHIQS